MTIEEEVLELRHQWDELKSRAFYILLGSITVFVAYGVWVGTVQTQVSSLTEDVNGAKEERANMIQRLGALEVSNGRVETTLASIQLTLQEIKIAIKQIQ